MNTRELVLTGVHNGNDIEHWDDLYNGIDLGYEEHIKNCEQYQDEEQCDCDLETGTTLLGGWILKNGLYEPDTDSEYSAIYNPDENTIQVLHSKYMIRCNMCSPCYPNQVDVDSTGEQIGYMLPIEIMTEEWIEENKSRFVE